MRARDAYRVLSGEADLDPDSLVTWCRKCRIWYPALGPFGFFRHLLDEHPDTPMAVAVAEQLARTEGKTA